MDNRYFKHGCPPLMSDARFLTNYMDNNVFNQYIRHTNKINNNNEYRKFLQDNADIIMKRERVHLVQKNTCVIPKDSCTYCCTPFQ